ncbi:hypothetical protein FEP81_04778 [Burkholderia multivorans]|nr:hypothetical protein [Burkholderia multivorans]
MRRGCVGAGRQQRHDRRIVAAEAVGAADAGGVDLRDEIALLHARLDRLDDMRMHPFDDARGHAHVFDLARRLHRALPVHECRRVDPARGGQVLLQRRVRGRAEVVVVEFDADAQCAPAARRNHFGRQVVHRVAIRRLHVMIGIADDVVVRHEHGALRAVRVLAAAEPHGFAVHRQQHALVYVERPAVIAGQPAHVGRVRDDKQVDAGPLHRRARLRDARSVFAARERKTRRGFVGFDDCRHLSPLRS